MSQGDEAAERYARMGKRKVNEDDAEPSVPSPEPTPIQRSNIQRLLNAAATSRPLFSPSFLPAPEPAAALVRPFSSSFFLPSAEPAVATMTPFSTSSFLPASGPSSIVFPSFLPPSTGQQIDQIIANHNQNLSNALYAIVEKKAEEIAARIINEKETEIQAKDIENAKLEEEFAYYKIQIMRLLPHSRNWEKTVAHLQKKLREAKAIFPNLDIGEDDSAESSNVNTDKVHSARYDCVVCNKIVANIMMWTCRHVSVCSECNESTPNCPVCGMPKISYVEVCIPTLE